MLLRTAFNVSPTICASDFPKAAKTDVLSGNQTWLARITPMILMDDFSCIFLDFVDEFPTCSH
jgi:hypothetical protein